MRHHWRRLSSEMVFDARIFRLREDRYEYRESPVHPFYVLETSPWTNVVAVTDDRKVLLLRQFRHGIEEETLEIPGGMVDPGEAPAEAAARELLEETGYEGRLRELGAVSSNPAILNNRTHLFLAEGARKVAEPKPDPHEDFEVSLVPEDEIWGLLASGQIHHSLCVCALSMYLLGRDA